MDFCGKVRAPYIEMILMECGVGIGGVIIGHVTIPILKWVYLPPAECDEWDGMGMECEI